MKTSEKNLEVVTKVYTSRSLGRLLEPQNVRRRFPEGSLRVSSARERTLTQDYESLSILPLPMSQNLYRLSVVTLPLSVKSEPVTSRGWMPHMGILNRQFRARMGSDLL